LNTGAGELRRRWRLGEQRLYPMIMVAPEAYEVYVRLVRTIADELKSCATLDELVDAYADRMAIVEHAAAGGGMSSTGLDLDLAVDAAFQLRHTELEDELQRAEVRRRIADMEERAGWVVLTESALVAEKLFPPYRRLEMHLPDGTGLDVSVELDLETGRPRYAVEVVQLDPATGALLPGREEPDRRQEFSESSAWQEAIAALRGGADSSASHPSRP
jgi:hypothetical protein